MHITNGESAGNTLRQTSLSGAVLPWQDVLHEGPVPTGSRRQLLRTRAGFLSGCGWGVDGSGRYLLFPLGAGHPRGGNSQNAYVAGHLACLGLRTGRVTRLPIPVMAEINGAFDAAW